MLRVPQRKVSTTFATLTAVCAAATLSVGMPSLLVYVYELQHPKDRQASLAIRSQRRSLLRITDSMVEKGWQTPLPEGQVLRVSYFSTDTAGECSGMKVRAQLGHERSFWTSQPQPFRQSADEFLSSCRFSSLTSSSMCTPTFPSSSQGLSSSLYS